MSIVPLVMEVAPKKVPALALVIPVKVLVKSECNKVSSRYNKPVQVVMVKVRSLKTHVLTVLGKDESEKRRLYQSKFQQELILVIE